MQTSLLIAADTWSYPQNAHYYYWETSIYIQQGMHKSTKVKGSKWINLGNYKKWEYIAVISIPRFAGPQLNFTPGI